MFFGFLSLLPVVAFISGDVRCCCWCFLISLSSLMVVELCSLMGFPDACCSSPLPWCVCAWCFLFLSVGWFSMGCSCLIDCLVVALVRCYSLSFGLTRGLWFSFPPAGCRFHLWCCALLLLMFSYLRRSGDPLSFFVQLFNLKTF